MWVQYVTVEDYDAGLARAKKNGATILTDPMDAEGVVRFGIFRDPFGGVIGVIRPAAG